MRIGAKLPNSGRLPAEIGIPAMARALEEAGFESLWVSDHIVMPETIASRYPFAADGKATWSSDMPWVDALVALSLAAAVTERAALGTAVLVVPLRHPVELAKQAASIDMASHGRLTLGVGAGWLEEEFQALNVPFEGRGARLDEWIEIARDCWTGRPGPRRSDRYELPAGVVCLPKPAHEIPVLIGGHSAAALRRAGRVGDGWLAQQSAGALSPEDIEAASAPGRIALRIVESAGRSDEVARHLPALARAGVDEVIVDLDWDGGDHARDHARLRDAVGAG